MISNALLKGCKRPEDLLGDAGLMKELKVRLMERMLGAELTAHLGYEAGAEPPPPCSWWPRRLRKALSDGPDGRRLP